MDPSKLKVVELRAELAARGLDQKGVKVVLVERLQKALESEGAEGIATPGNESIDQGDSVEHECSEPPDQEEDDDEHVDEIENIDDQPEEHEEEDDDQNPDNYEVNDEVGEDDVKEEVVASEPNESSPTTQPETIIDVKEEQEKSENETARMEVEGEKTEEIKKDEENKEIKDSPNKDKDLKKSDYSDRKNRKRGRSRSPPRRGDRRSPTRNQPAKNTDDFTKEEEEPEINENAVVLSWYDSDLHLEVDPDFVNAKPLSDAALSLAWAGARSTHGIKSGRVLYEVQLTGHNQFYNNFPDEKDLYELRVGWSTQKSNLQLGENALSFSYASSGKKAVNNEFSEYGIRYELDDVVGAYLDLESSPCKIEFTVNGKSQGYAFEFEKSILESEALFPHIISKNTVFRVNFGQVENGMLPLVKPKKPKHSKDAKRDKRDRRDSKRSDRADSERKEKPVKEEEETSKELPKDKAEESKQSEQLEEVETKNEVLNVAEIAVDVEMKELPSEELAATSLIKEAEEPEKKVEDVIEPPAILELLEGYIYINTVNEEELVAGPKRPNTRLDCEVIMMVGLPGSGKTHWATKHAEENPNKYYNILGNTALIDRMKINGETRRKCHIGKWERLIEWCNRTLIVLQDIATRRRRNFILDQTNVYASAQRRKMRGFGEFKRIAVVVIPEEEEFKQRYDKKIENEGKEVPDTALNEMKANFAMPTTEYGWFTEIRYTDLEGETAQKAIEEFNENGRKALPPPTKRRRFDDRRRDPMRRDRNRWGDRRRNDRYGGGNGSGYDRRGGGSGYDRRDRGWNSGNGSSNWSGSRRGSSSRFDDRRGGSGRDRDRDRREYRPRERSRGRDDKKRDSRRVSGDRNRNGGSSNNWSSSGQHWGDDQFGGWGGNFQNQGYGGQTGWANNGWGNWGSNQWSNAQNTSNNAGQWKNYGTSNSSGNTANPQQWMNYWQNDEYRSPTKQESGYLHWCRLN